MFITISAAWGYTTPKQSVHQHTSSLSSRRQILNHITKASSLPFLTIATLSQASQPVQAFEGAGSNAGRLTTKGALKKSYEERIIADVRDFNALGRAIDAGDLDGKAWINFFIPYQRREPDDVGRTFAALADLVGSAQNGGGCGILYVGTFVKPGKPAEGTVPYKKFMALSKMFAPIEAAGKSGSVEKAKSSWGKAAAAFEEFLAVVDLPASLSDPAYN